jgi:C1A family cysteine protease
MPARVALLAVAAAALATLSGGLHDTGAAGAPPRAPAGAPPWTSAGPFPASYDVRSAVPGYTRLSPVREQKNYSTCWAMAATGALEAGTIAAEGTTPRYSPNNLANHSGSRLDYEGMAPSEVAVAYYARWEGPVADGLDPYPRKGRSPLFLPAVRHVQDVLFLPPRTGPADNDAVKWAVQTYGAVDVAAAFHAQEERRNWNPETNAYCGETTGPPNHHLLIVGWDDAYPRSDFLRRPPGDGAFLVKNSWGPDFGDRGFLWISYYDAGFGQAMAVFCGVEGARAHDAVYQYDALGRSGWIAVTDGAESGWYADRFVCVGSGDLSAVAFYTPVTGTSYEVRVASSLRSVAAVEPAAAGTAAVAGYHTVRLERPVRVTAGASFVVAVKVTSPGWTRPVPVERPSSLIAPRARPGQSFVSADGASWTDLTQRTGLSRASVCLKAFVDDPAGKGDTARPRAIVRGGTVRPGATATVRWRLTDPAFSSASAVVVLSVRDRGGTLLLRRRIPAVAVGERGVWRFTARWPAGRYTVRGLAYDVAGHRQAAPGRAVLLVRGRAVPRATAGAFRR